MRKRCFVFMLIFVMLFESAGVNVSAAATTVEEDSLQKEADDLVISSPYVLEEDLVVRDLIVEGRSIDLNGHQLRVLGEIIQTSGQILFNRGELLCEGDYAFNGGTIHMDNGNDYLKVGGKFLCQTYADNSIMSAGTIEITGDFVQKQAVGSTVGRKNFICTGAHTVIFSGKKRQSIHFDSPASHFNHVILKNTSEEGVYSDTLINSLSMERNSTQITTESLGEYGWTMQEDQVYDGDLYLLGDTLDLNGHSLHIKGSLYHMNGGIEINGGSLIVDGDFRLQQEMAKTAEIGAASSFLSMRNPDDRIQTGGDFITESTVDHSTYLQQGVLEVKGDVEQKGDIQKSNLVMSSDSTLYLTGTKQQRIFMESAGKVNSRLANLEVVNAQGIELATDTYISGNVSDHGNPVSGKYLVIQKETTFTDGSFTGNIRTEDQFVLQSLHTLKGDFVNTGSVSLGTDLVVKGNFDTRKIFRLGGYTLEVSGDTRVSGNIQILKGRLICGGDFEQVNSSDISTLIMLYQEDYVLVKGNFYVNCRYASGSMTAGTLELKGDFVHTTPGVKENFCASGTHVTIFSGDSLQTVTFESDYSFFNHVEILNESEQGVYAPNGINCGSINRNGNKITTDGVGEFGWELTKDENYEGDLYLISDELNLNGHTLTIEGDLIQSAGTVNVNGGKLVVQGDYRIQAEKRENETVTYDGSIGYLQMTKEEDQVLVEGDFVMGSIHSHKGKLSAGKLSVKGDVSVVRYKATDNFAATDSHLLVLAGQEPQKINLARPSFNDMRIANLRLANESTEGVILETDLPVTGEVSDNGNQVVGRLLISSQTLFEDGTYNGDVMISSGGRIKNLKVLNGNLTITGNIMIQNDLSVNGEVYINGGYLNVAGNEFRVAGNVTVEAGYLQPAKGACICEGDMILEYNNRASSFLMMTESEDYVCVNGNFYAHSRSMSSTVLTKGTLELKGDFEHKKTVYDDGFIASGEHRMILTGEKLQTVTFDSKDSYFSHVEILNTSEEGVYSEEGIHCQYLETNGNVYRTGKEGTAGWTLQGDEKWDGDLVLARGTLDLQGHELVINGNLIQNGGNVKINGGVLRVNGNYIIGETTGVEPEEATGSWAALLMQREEDAVYVQNDFVMASYINHSTYLTAGAFHVCGDLTQKAPGSKKNLASTSGFTLVLEGAEIQNIKMETPHTSYSTIANLIIDNTSEKGVFLDDMLVTGEVSVRNGCSVHGELDAVSTTVFLDEWYTGDVAFRENTVYTRPLKIRGYLNCQTNFSMKADVTVEGNLRTGGVFELNANTLRVSGDINVNSSRIRVGAGKVFCGGTLYLEYRSRFSSGIEMTEEKGYVLVEGDVEADSASGTPMTKGTLEIRGNFIQNWFDARGAFAPSEDFVVLLSGQHKQKVSFADPGSRFGTLHIKNESAEGVYFENDSIRAAHLERNGCLVTCKGKGTYGWILSEDMVLEDDLYIVMDELDLNGHSLTINGNLYIGAGSVKVNGGTLKISEDLRLQNYDGKGNYSDSSGRLIMTDTSDQVTVGGDFITQTSKSEEGYLTAGVLEIQGNFRQKSAAGMRKNFSASGTHKVDFTGEEEQDISLENPFDSGFMDISFSEAERDVKFLSDVYVAGTVSDLCQRVLFEDKKYIHVKGYSQFEGGEFSGNVSCSDPAVLQEDIRIGGTLSSTALIDLNGRVMKVGKLEKSSGELWIHGGSLSAETDIRLTSGAYVVMKDEADRICIKGGFEMLSDKDSSFNEFLAGKLEINGDVTIGSEGFVPEGSHQTILSGRVGATGRDYIQTILITKEGVKFNELVLTKDKDRFYVFSDDVNKLCRKLTAKGNDGETLSRVTGLRTTGLDAAAVSLEWEEAQGNQKAEGYYIFRGSSRIGKTAETKYTDKGLKPETEYRYTVCAFDKKGNASETSDVLTVITKCDTKAPDKPTCTKIVTRTGSSVTVGWNKAKDDVGVSKYRIYRDGEQIAEVSGDQYTYRDINRIAGEEHTYRVSALDEAGNESSLSKSIKGTARMPKIRKVVPEGGAELGGASAELTVYYDNVGNSTGNKVRFQYSTDQGDTWQDINISLLGQNEHNYSTLYSKCTWDISRIKQTECLVRTVLYDSENNTDETETHYRIDTEPPVVPECVSAQSKNGQVELSWNPSDSANCASYELYRAEGNGAFEKIQVLKGRENTEYMDRNVTQRTTYTYYVRAVDSYGLISGGSGKATVTVSDDMEKPRVLSFSASKGRLGKEAKLTIKAVDNIGITSVIAEYFDGSRWIKLGQSDAPGGMGVVCFDTTKIEDGQYTFRALAEDRNGNMSEGYVHSFVIDNTGVEKVQVDEVSAESDKVRITWKPVPDEDIDYYVVEQKVGRGFSEVARESSIMGTYIKELNAETSYCFRIVGYDTAGNRGEASEDIWIRTEKDKTAPYVVKFNPVISYYRDTIPLEITAEDNIELGVMKFSCSYDKINWEELETVQAPEGSKEYTYCYDMDIQKYKDGVLYVRAVCYDRAGNVNTKAQAIRTFHKITTPPETVKKIYAVAKDGYIKVEWGMPDTENFESFDLYRKSSSDHDYKCVEKETGARNYFDMMGKDNEEISYKIVVNDLAGNRSEFSKEVSATMRPDTEDPKVYGVSPGTGKKVGINPEITTLIADNRRLKDISVEFRRQGSGDLWTEIYNEKTRADSWMSGIVWENEELDDGTYEFRISAKDSRGNASEEYVFSYIFDSEYVDGADTEISGDISDIPGEGVKPGDTEQKETLTVMLPEEYTLRQGKEQSFDGTNVKSDADIVSWKWDFGNGHTENGAVVTYAYPETGTYTLALTVKDAEGRQARAVSEVKVLSKSSGGVSVRIRAESGAILENAQIYIQKNGEKEGKNYTGNSNGELEVALDAGTYKISAYQTGHIPLQKEVKIAPGAVRKVEFSLESNEVVTGTLTHRKLDVREIMELGVDLSDPDNWYTYTYTVVTYFRKEPKPKVYGFYVSEGKWTYAEGTKGGGSAAYTVVRIPGAGTDGEEHILIRYETVEYLKQMFEVELCLQNQAGKEFSLTNGTATLNLPEGLSLAGMKKGKQTQTVQVEDIPGKSEETVRWYIRGDKPGEYSICAGYSGRLQPFDAPVNITIQDKEPVVVTEENTNTNTDDGFLDPDKEVKNYQILVTNPRGAGVRGAYVEMWYGDLSTRGITDSDGFVWLEVNEGDSRTFRLTIQCEGYKNYEDKNYKVNKGDYMDSIRIIPKGREEYKDKNDEYKGDFALTYVSINDVDASAAKMKINAYEVKNNSAELHFSEKVTEASIVAKGKDQENFVEIASKNDISSTKVMLNFQSNNLTKGYEVYVRAVDEESGTWHLYLLEKVEVVYEEPDYDVEEYDQELAEQCALYSALAYAWESSYKMDEQKEKDSGFTYNTKQEYLSATKPDAEGTYIDLRKKLEMDGFEVEGAHMYSHYGDQNRDNCSYSIAHCSKAGKTYVYVIIRGTDSVEWFGNMKCTGERYVSGMQQHYSFNNAMKDVKQRLVAYIVGKDIKDAHVVITGHSRGAAVANLLAKEMIDLKNENGVEDNDEKKRLASVCAYTFATPNCTTAQDVKNKEYNSIFNFCLEDDFVPQVPMSNWGYDKYGITFYSNADQMSDSNNSYVELIKKIRGLQTTPVYNEAGTKELIEHLSENWEDIDAYYNDYHTIFEMSGKEQKVSLFEYMHNIVAKIITTEKTKDCIREIGSLAFSMLDVDIIDFYKFIDQDSNLLHLYDKYGSIYGKISQYFFIGSDKAESICQKYIFNTHNADNYYALLKTGGFDTIDKQFLKKASNTHYLSSSFSKMQTNENQSDDANIFREVLTQTIVTKTESGETEEKSVADVLGWDINDISTWKGITFENGRIVSISLNQSCFQGLKLDLSGLDKLEELYCVFTGFREIVLTDCTALKKITILHNWIEKIDVSDCEKLVELDVRYNQLESILFGRHPDIYRMVCNGNYLDVDSDMDLLAVIAAVKENGGTSNYDSQSCQKNAQYSDTDMQVIQKMLSTGDNAEKLGWDPEDRSTWTGVEWKTVSGYNYIKKIEMESKQLQGTLDVSDLKYLQTLQCSQNEFSEINVSGCKKLTALHCTDCKLTSLLLEGADELLYLSCSGNYLQIDEIEEMCKKIQKKEGSVVSYEKQFILADRSAFNEEECKELERFAGYGNNGEIMKWDKDRPGLMQGVSWVVKDGEYRVSEIDFLGKSVSGVLDLSGFTSLKEICMIATDITEVKLPVNLKDLGEKAFMNCADLEKATLTDGILRIGEKAFKGCKELTSLTLPESVTEISESAFEGCEALEEVTVTGNLEILSHYAFCGCKQLKKVSFWGAAPSGVGEKVFLGTPEDMCIYYDPSQAGWTDPVWKQYNMVKMEEEPVVTPAVPGGSTQGPVLPEETQKPDVTAQPVQTGVPVATALPGQSGETGSNENSVEVPEVSSDVKKTLDEQKKPEKKCIVSKARIFKCKVKQNTIIVTLKKNKLVTGYEIRYRKGKKGKYKALKWKGWKKNRKVLRNLKRNSTYYIKVRAYKVLEGKTYYSGFSKTRKIKVR